MNRYIRSIFFLASIMISQTAMAQNTNIHRANKSVNEISYKYAQCAAYFNLMAVCLKVSSYPQSTINAYKRLSSIALKRGLEMGKIINLSEDAHAARFQIEMNSQMKLLNKSCVNISSLQIRFENLCENLMKYAR